jgi:zinc/manganese transport system substrate-binding protein
MNARRLALAIAALCALATAPALTAPASAAPPVQVVASFSILGDMVARIGGDDVVVTTIVGPDGDAHVYEPTPADAQALGAADLLVTNGLNLEGFLPRLVEASGFHGMTVVASDGVTPRHFGPDDPHDEDEAAAADHDHGDVDPHAWQNLANGEVYARNIGAALAAIDPAHAADYQARTDAYVAEMQALDAQVRTALQTIPEDRRLVVTTHDAFGYFGAAYGVSFIAPEGLSTESEASAGDVARIIDQIRQQGITAVFVENITNPRLLQQIADETGARIGGELYSDALSGTDGPAPTYLAMFRWNLGQLTQALGESS